MRKGLLGSVASALLGAGSALAQPPAYPPVGSAMLPPALAYPTANAPVLLPADPRGAYSGAYAADASPAPADLGLTGGSTGLRPGVDSLPNPDEVAPKPPRFYGDIAYMLSWFKDQNVQPLVTAGPVGTLPSPGTLGRPGTIVLNGGRDSQFDPFNGLRATAGMWLNCDRTFGIEGSGFLLEHQTLSFAAGGTGDPAGTLAVARPFIDPAFGPTSVVVASPGGNAGGVFTALSSRLWGAEGNFVLNWSNSCRMRTDLLAGFRYLDLEEGLVIDQFTRFQGGPLLLPPPPISLNDTFKTRTQFYGGQVGTRTALTFGRLTVSMDSKLAMGLSHEVVDREGSSTIHGAVPFTTFGGFLVRDTNAGRDTRDWFAVVPETLIQVGYQWTDHLSTFIGYDFLYISTVVRPADQIDSVVNQFSAAPARPMRGIEGSDFYANSLLLGLSYRW